MANQFLYVDWLAMKSLQVLENKLVIAGMMNTDYDKEFERDFAVGETIKVKFPQRFLIRDGLGYSEQPINRLSTTVTVNQPFGIDFGYDSIEEALKMERGREMLTKEYIEPAMAQLAQEIDSRAALFMYQNTNNIVGTLGSNSSTIDTAWAANQRLFENSCPPGDDKCMVVTPGQQRSLGVGLTTLFNPNKEISRQYLEGSMGKAVGFDWYQSMSLYSHTAGTLTSPATNAAVASGASSLTISCTTGDTVAVGDVFNVASVNNVNPSTRRTTGTLKQLVVTQAATGANSAMTINFYPTLYGPGSQYQNVDALPASNATVTLFPGTTSPNGVVGSNGLAFTKQAFALVSVPLVLPKAVELSSRATDPDTGVTIQFIRAFDPISRKMINRFDVLLGFGVLYADQCAVRYLGLN